MRRRDSAVSHGGAGTRTPSQILAHIGDLLDWVLSQAEGRQAWKETPPGEWSADVERFHRGLAALDAYLASEAPLAYPAARMFQGGIADALTHVGQIAMLRRMAGGPVRAENYFQAEIVIGRVGTEQTKPRREFVDRVPKCQRSAGVPECSGALRVL